MKTFSALFIAAILAMALGAPEDIKVIKKYAENSGGKWEWQMITELKYNIESEQLDIVAGIIFDVFPYQTDDRLRMQELVISLDNAVSLGSMCPPGNNWSVLGFKLCEKEAVLGNPEGRYVIFHYSNDEDLDGAGYALYNDCK